MARIVVNPHKDTEGDIRQALIHGKILTHRGEILICNEPGNEGVYVLNSRNQLVKVGVNLSTASSAITKEYIDQLILDIDTALGDRYTKEETDNRIIEFMSGYSGTSIDENVVRNIASGVVTVAIEDLIDGADEDYNTLGKISNWILSNSGADFTEIIEEINGLRSDVSGITENVSNLDERVNYLEGVVSGVTKSTDHFVMTFEQYQELTGTGRVYVEGYGRITYSDEHFYCIIESGDVPPTPSEDSAIVSGDTVVFDENHLYDDSDKSIDLGEIEISEEGVLEVDWVIDDDSSDEPSEDIEVSGTTVNTNSEYTFGEPLNIGVIDDNNNGIVDVSWEI
jgi:hypothetical protein